MRSPSVHVAKQLAERHVVLEIDDVLKRLSLRWVVVKHQQDSGERQNYEQVKRDPAHPPCVTEAHRVAIDLRRVQMQEDVGQHTQ